MNWGDKKYLFMFSGQLAIFSSPLKSNSDFASSLLPLVFDWTPAQLFSVTATFDMI